MKKDSTPKEEEPLFKFSLEKEKGFT